METNTPEELMIEDGDKEFNSQFEFFKLIYRIKERRNLINETGGIDRLAKLDLVFKAMDDLLAETSPKLKDEKIETEGLKTELRLLGKKLYSSVLIQNQEVRNKNSIAIELDLQDIYYKINQLIHEAGIIYPKKKRKTTEEAIEEDF